MSNSIQCPKCGSTEIHASNRGWSIWTGFIGARKVHITCLSCAHEFKPGQQGLSEHHSAQHEEPASELTEPIQQADNHIKDVVDLTFVIAVVVVLGVVANGLWMRSDDAHESSVPQTAQSDQRAQSDQAGAPDDLASDPSINPQQYHMPDPKGEVLSPKDVAAFNASASDAAAPK